MGFFGRLGTWLRRLFGASRAETDSPPSRRLGDLLTGESSVAVVSASISDHVARVVLAEPVSNPPDDVFERRVLETAWRALREHPAEGPILALEVWAPPAVGRPAERALRRQFKSVLDVSSSPSREGQVHPPPSFAGTGDHAVATGPPEPPDPSLRSLGEYLAVPDRLVARLRARGVDASHPQLVSFVTALLAEAAYEVSDTRAQGRVTDLDVTSTAGRVFVRCYASDGHVLPPTIDRFAFSFLSSRASEGFFVTDGLLPFESRHWERDPRIHLLDRVGIQRLVDAIAAGPVAAPARPTP